MSSKIGVSSLVWNVNLFRLIFISVHSFNSSSADSRFIVSSRRGIELLFKLKIDGLYHQIDDKVVFTLQECIERDTELPCYFDYQSCEVTDFFSTVYEVRELIANYFL